MIITNYLIPLRYYLQLKTKIILFTIIAAYRGEEMHAKKILMRDADIILTTLASSYNPVMQEFFQGRFLFRARNSDDKS